MPLKNSSLKAVYEWQNNRLNHRTDIQICSQAMWDCHKSVTVVMGNYFLDHNSRCMSSVSWPQRGWLQALTLPPFNLQAAITGTKAKPVFYSFHHKTQKISTPS